MNKSFGLFLALVAFIAVFAVVVMVQVPRKGVVMAVPDAGSSIATTPLART